jgi:hypothetical protein
MEFFSFSRGMEWQEAQSLSGFEDSSLIDSRLDHCKERTNFALEKVNVGGRSLGQSIGRRSPKTDREIYMKGKVIKRLTMLSLVSMFTLCAAVASANAQLSIPIRAKIPFDFTVGDKKLAAGEYTFSRLSGSSDNKVLSVSSVDASAHVFQSIFKASVLTPKNESTLVFHRYGDQYFLEQIWTGGEQEGSQLSESRGERTVRQQLTQTQQSNMSGKVIVETVNIVAGLL